MAPARLSATWLLACALLLGGRAAPAQQLSAIRDSVVSPNTHPTTEEPPRSRKTRRRSYDGCDDDSFFAELGLFALATPYLLPYYMFDEPCCDRFESYSQQETDHGFKETDWFCRSTEGVSSARGLVEYGTDFSDIDSVGAKLQVDLPVARMTLDASAVEYSERMVGGGSDSLTLGDANLVFRFAQNSYTVWRSGLGVNWMADARDDVGFNFTYGFDYLPSKPYVVSAEIDWGRLGETHLFRGRTTVGVQWRDFEAYTGYEYLDIESVELSTMLFGVRGWW
ncbi:hypothetical protein Mal64_19060 [Pseudobythopirellula maris]|uniref:Outer membrane protein beta-barrel domain-containing protein n=1 Tax=Pseudobythopirellula maris TaxID=2527991 RepID=A0A5C5ZMY3_9BACT|nr:hypothetical protein [Pseudobythopirellula maris]TWT88425.1 hypothetical protein Mal64_19060 [Pseudobythopirellula maris]